MAMIGIPPLQCPLAKASYLQDAESAYKMNSPVNHAGITVDAVDCFAEQCILTIVEWLRG